MKINKAIVFTIMVILIFSTFATPIYAATVSLSGTSSVTAGSSVSIRIVLGESSYGAEGTISYDASMLTFASSSAGSGWTATYSSGSKRFTAYRPNGDTAAGTILTLKFRAKSGVSGTTTISATSVKVSTPGGEKSTSASKNVTISQSATPSKPATPVVQSTDATLKSLTIGEGTLTPSFAAGTTKYSLSVPSTTDRLTINAQKNNTKASVSIGSYRLTQGDSVPVYIVVTAENGNKRTYTIQVTRELPGDYVASDNALLTSLSASFGSLSPAFNSNTFHYAIDVPYECTKITFKAQTAFQRAKYNVLGNSTLTPGADNVFYAVVMAEDNKTSKVYTVTVRRSAVYSIYLQNEYVNGIINQINQQTQPVIMDLAAAPIQVVASSILTALKDNPDRKLVIECIGARVTITGSDLTESIKEGFYDFTINTSSQYEDEMMSKASDAQSFVFSTHQHGPWPANVEYAIDTGFITGTDVNIYRYDAEKDQYVTVAKNVAVNGGTVVFTDNQGGDYLITTANLGGAVTSGSTPSQPSSSHNSSIYYMIGMGLILLPLGIVVGVLGSRYFRKRQNKQA